jgi:hypothetical protein
MDRRAMLGMLGAGAVGLAVTPGPEARAMDLDKTHEDCLKACSECARTCDETFHHCYQEVAEGKRDHARPLHFLSDCAGFCGLSACMIARHSPLMVDSCAACAEACRKTAAVVEKFDSAEMKRAAEKLRACEKSCTNMVAVMKGHGPSAAEPK